MTRPLERKRSAAPRTPLRFRTLLEGAAQVVVVLLNGGSHHHTEHREQQAGDVLNVREEHGAVRLWFKLEFPCSAKCQSPPTLPCQRRRRPGTTSVSFALTFAEGRLGMARVSF